MQGRLQARVQLVPWGKQVHIAFIQEMEDGRYGCAVPLEFKPREDYQEVQPCATLEPLAAQQLMDDLWYCGFRPSEGTGSAGQLASVQYHLEDMRKLVFQRQVAPADSIERTGGNVG